jgi:hypothetical protein
MTVPGRQAGRQAAIWFTTQAMWVPSNGTGVDDDDNYGIAHFFARLGVVVVLLLLQLAGWTCYLC